MIITYESLYSASRGGVISLNHDQFDLLGVPFPPRHGWVKHLIGKEIPDDVWCLILAIGGKKKKPRKSSLNRVQKDLPIPAEKHPREDAYRPTKPSLPHKPSAKPFRLADMREGIPLAEYRRLHPEDVAW